MTGTWARHPANRANHFGVKQKSVDHFNLPLPHQARGAGHRGQIVFSAFFHYHQIRGAVLQEIGERVLCRKGANQRTDAPAVKRAHHFDDLPFGPPNSRLDTNSITEIGLVLVSPSEGGVARAEAGADTGALARMSISIKAR